MGLFDGLIAGLSGKGPMDSGVASGFTNALSGPKTASGGSSIPNPSAPPDSSNPNATPTDPLANPNAGTTAGTPATDPLANIQGSVGITPDAQSLTASPTGIAPGGNALAAPLQQHNALAPTVAHQEHPLHGFLRQLLGSMGGAGGGNNFLQMMLRNMVGGGGGGNPLGGLGAAGAAGAAPPAPPAGGPALGGAPGPTPMPPTPAPPMGSQSQNPFANLFAALGGNPSAGNYSVG